MNSRLPAWRRLPLAATALGAALLLGGSAFANDPPIPVPPVPPKKLELKDSTEIKINNWIVITITNCEQGTANCPH